MKIHRLTIFIAAALAGCTTAKQIIGPDGTHVYAIDCHPAMPNDCLEKAGEVCPSGYMVLNATGSKSLGQVGSGSGSGQWSQLGGGVSGSTMSVPILTPNSMLIECKTRK